MRRLIYLGLAVVGVTAALPDPTSAQYERTELKQVPTCPAPGRANYGLRRLMLDAVVDDGLDPEAVQEFGGWTDSDTPNRVYRDKVRKEAGLRARDARARIKGDVVQA